MKNTMRTMLAACLLHACSVLTAQTWPWGLTSSGTGIVTGIRVAADASGNSYTSGSYYNGTCIFGAFTLPAPAGLYDAFLTKVNSSGTVQWAVRAGSTGDDDGGDVATNGSDVFVTGNHQGNITFYSTGVAAFTVPVSGTSDRCYLARYNSAGNLQWATSFTGSGGTQPMDIAINDAQQRIYVTGTSGGQAFVACYNYSGVQQYSFTPTGTAGSYGWGIGGDASGNCYVLMTYGNGNITFLGNTYSGTLGMLLVKLTPAGAISWVQNIGGATADYEYGRGLGMDAAGNVYIGGQYYGTTSISGISLPNAGGSSTYDLFVAKYNSLGTVQWATRMGGVGYEHMNGFVTAPNGDTYVNGWIQDNNTVTAGCKTYVAQFGNNDNKFFVAKLSNLGTLKSTAAPLAMNTINSYAIDADGSGNILITGSITGTLTVGSTTLMANGEAFLTKLSMVDETPTAVGSYTACNGAPVTLTTTAPVGGGVSIKWYNSGSTLVGTMPSYVTSAMTVPSTTTYFVSALYPSGCESAKIPVQVTALATNILVASADQTICAGDPVTISFTGAASANVTPGIGVRTSPFTITPSATTNYTLTNASPSACEVGDQVKVTVIVPSPFLGTYSASVYNPGSCTPALSSTSKNLCLTPSIGATMPSNTNLNLFRCEIGNAVGWEGAGNVGVNNLTFSNSYTVEVYEVDASGNRAVVSGITAPPVFLITGTGPSTGDINFNSSGNGAGFDGLNPPFYVDPTAAADPAGLTGGGDYFKAFYTFSRSAGTLAAYSARIFCVDMKQQTIEGCLVSKKSYFRIANNGAANGSGAKLASGLEEADGVPVAWTIYPNPSSALFVVELDELNSNAKIDVYDYAGRHISTQQLSGQRTVLDLSGQAKGIYFAKLSSSSGHSEMKKIVLE